jgi:hypothetical protein
MIRPLPAALAALLVAGCSGNPCNSPLEQCGNLCLDLHSDGRNCGACGHVCGAGLACVSSACVPDTAAAVCSTRTGGAFVTLGVCGEVVKVWISSAYASTFITRAQALAADPASPGLRMPQFDLRDGTDCDGQWNWHVEAATAAWVAAPSTVCSACPSVVEAAEPYWVFSVGSWCPDPAVQGVHVLSVELR